MRKEDCYYLGKITRRHGLQGNVLMKLDTDQPEFYSKLESVFVEVNGLLVPFFIEKRSWSKHDTLNVYFKNATEQMVEQCIGRNVFLPLSTLPPLSGKQFYYHEVVGYQIKDQQNSYGVIQEINDQAAQHYFVLDLDGKTVIVPMIKDWIVAVDREHKMITMDLPEGLLDVFLKDSPRDE